MTTIEKTPAVRQHDQGNENLAEGISTPDLTLRPLPGRCWALSIAGRPALMFNHLYHAAQTMHDINADLADGFALWGGDFDHVTAEYLDFVATGSVRGPWRKAGADHRVYKGWD